MTSRVPGYYNGPHTGMHKCAICVATYRRPSGLSRLVHGLGRLDVTSCESLSPEIIIADNDPAGTARGLCEQLSQGSRWPITYVCEPRRGIPFARNTVVRCALDRGSDYLALVDDDVVPDAGWLREMWLTMTHYAADIVTGPAVPYFEGSVAKWLRVGGFFDCERYPTGTPRDRAHTDNILMRADVFARSARFFDERFRLSGGEDTDFFLHAALAGCKIVWANDAIVREWIPETRARVGWLLKRAYRWGIVWGQLSADQEALRRQALRGMAKGGLWLPWSFVQGPAAVVRALQLIATGAGYLAARAGFRFEEYQQTHGS